MVDEHVVIRMELGWMVVSNTYQERSNWMSIKIGRQQTFQFEPLERGK